MSFLDYYIVVSLLVIALRLILTEKSTYYFAMSFYTPQERRSNKIEPVIIYIFVTIIHTILLFFAWVFFFLREYRIFFKYDKHIDAYRLGRQMRINKKGY